jgi:hypothetical protein
VTDQTPLTEAEREEMARLSEIADSRGVIWDVFPTPDDPGYERAMLKMLRQIVGEGAGR